MRFEVELKFPLPDSEAFQARLNNLGAVAGDPQKHRDIYFNHPARDFAQTDEALRIRCLDDAVRVTYKGPLQDPLTKTRRELEIPLGSGGETAEQFAEMLLALGFRRVREVIKTRYPFHFSWRDRKFEATIDDVEGLGSYCELETLADDADVDTARQTLLALAESLGLTNSERRSYLRLLLEQDAANQPGSS
jgi:adenylate cyclase class 2